MESPYSIDFSRQRLDPRAPRPRVPSERARPRSGRSWRGQNEGRVPRPRGTRPFDRSSIGSDLGDVRRLLALRARDQVELHPFPLGERAEAARADGREVHEDVLSRVRRDEAEALRVVEPLHRALHASFRRPRLRRRPRRTRTTAAPGTVASAGAATTAVAPAITRTRARSCTGALRRIEAVAAQHRPARRGHERHLGIAAAVRTRRWIHLLFGSAVTPAGP